MKEHDDWLRAALRHAPDADVTPPATLRAAILAQARANAPRPLSLRARIGALLAALARPPVTTAVASLVACTVLGVMWSSGALDEGLAPRPQAPSPAAEPAALPAPAAESPAAAAPAASPARAADGDATRSARKPSPARRETADQQYSPPAGATPSIASPAPAPATPPPPQADVEPRAALRAESRARADKQEADTTARRMADSAPSAVTAWAPTASPVAEAAFDPLQALRRRAEDGALQWTIDGRTHTHAEGQRAWLAALDAAAGRRWRRDDEPAAANATTLRLQDGERLLAEFALGADRVRIALPGGSWVAVLDPAQAAQLRAAAQRW